MEEEGGELVLKVDATDRIVIALHKDHPLLSTIFVKSRMRKEVEEEKEGERGKRRKEDKKKTGGEQLEKEGEEKEEGVHVLAMMREDEVVVLPMHKKRRSVKGRHDILRFHIPSHKNIALQKREAGGVGRTGGGGGGGGGRGE